MELAQLGESFKGKVARGEARWASSGFTSGKGFTFDADELNEEQRKAGLQKRAYEMEQGIYEEASDEEDGFEGDDRPAPPPLAPLIPPVFAITSASAHPEPPPPPIPHVVPTPVNADGLSGVDKARALASSMIPSRLSEPTLQLHSTSAPLGHIDTHAALARARMIAAQVIAPPRPNIELNAFNDTHFSDEVEINDYPVQARKKVTHRLCLDDIAERTGVNVISRGAYMEPGKPLKLGERKLYLLLEGTSEMQVKQAKLEILRVLDEETLKLGASISMGRYAVV